MKLNTLVPSINFTIDKESHSNLPFLDVLIGRHDREFKYKIYRKPTNILSYVHFYLQPSTKIKISVFSSMFLRALRICSDQFLNEEINYIKNIAKSHQYPSYIIDKAYKLAYNSFTNVRHLNEDRNNNRLVLPYHDNFKHLPFIFRHHFNIEIVFKNAFSLGNFVIKNTPCSDTGVVYRINCKDCDSFYIGQSGKSLNTRIKQHKYSIKTAQLSNALFVHLNNNNHGIDFGNSKVISKIKNINNRYIVESALINYNQNKTVNLCPGLYKLDPFIVSAIVKFLNITNI